MNRTQVFCPDRNATNPQWLEAVVNGRRAAYLWLALRLFVGWQWLWAGSHKLFGPSSIGWVNDGFVGDKMIRHGDKLLAFWQQAAAPSSSPVPQVAYPWYRALLGFFAHHQWQTHFVYVISYGEALLGVALLLGAFTAIASLSAAVLNFNYMLAGSASINPVLFLSELLMLVAWRRAGAVGLAGWLITPLVHRWQSGHVVERARGHVQAPRPIPYQPLPPVKHRRSRRLARHPLSPSGFARLVQRKGFTRTWG